ncbi:MAG: sugar kinase [Bacteroidia bacterium]|nr:sugar kinase [Bacteroidia bacterium]
MPAIVTFGELMMRLSPPGVERLEQAREFGISFGGVEANVAVALARWGWQARHVTRFPDSPLGLQAVQYLRSHGVDCSQVLLGGERMGLYFIETGAMSRAARVVYDRAGSAFATLEPGRIPWDAALAGADWFHWSGVTAGISAAAAACCMEGIQAARRLGLRVSCDIHYRSNLFRYGAAPAEVLRPMAAESTLLLASAEHAEQLFGLAPEPGADAFASCAQQLMRQYPGLRYVAETQRESQSASHHRLSARMAHAGGLLETGAHTLLPIVDRIGSGDAFAAGLLYALGADAPPQAALEFALAAAALKHSIPGDALLATVLEVQTLADGDGSGKLIR